MLILVCNGDNHTILKDMICEILLPEIVFTQKNKSKSHPFYRISEKNPFHVINAHEYATKIKFLEYRMELITCDASKFFRGFTCTFDTK